MTINGVINDKKSFYLRNNEKKRKQKKGKNMYNIERREEILNILEKNKSVSVNKLSELLFVSPPTIRRDLTCLEEEGKVKRTHGGVVLRKTAESEIPLMLREDQNSKSKQKIAERHPLT